MTQKDEQTAKDRIIQAAISLFAKKGFAATGVREIAEKADVNLAMISYYFKGKMGILQEIIEIYFRNYRSIFSDVDDPDLSDDACVEHIIGKLFDFVKRNTQLVMVVYNEMPYDVPELLEIKKKYVLEIMAMVSGLTKRFGIDDNSHLKLSIIGPLLISSILTNFRFRPFLGKMFDIKTDENYDAYFIETLSQLILYGLHGGDREKY